jgi:hypothetical protein
MQICAALIGVHDHVFEDAFESCNLEDEWCEDRKPRKGVWREATSQPFLKEIMSTGRRSSDGVVICDA